MPLSPHEESVLATLEKELRADDPDFADALGSGPAAVPAPPPLLRPRQVLVLAGALAGLAVVGTVGGERLGPVGLAAVTAVATVPWLVAAVRSADRRARAATTSPRVPAKGRRRRPGVTPPRALLLGAAAAGAMLALLPSAVQAAAGLALVFGMLPVLAWVVLRRPERPGR